MRRGIEKDSEGTQEDFANTYEEKEIENVRESIEPFMKRS